MDDKKQKPEGLTHLLATFSATFTGDDQPMIAARIKADGKEVDLPFILVLGNAANPMVLAGQMNDPEVRLGYTSTLSKLGADLTASVVEELKEVFSQAKQAEGASKTERGPEAATPPAPSLDSEVV